MNYNYKSNQIDNNIIGVKCENCGLIIETKHKYYFIYRIGDDSFRCAICDGTCHRIY